MSTIDRSLADRVVARYRVPRTPPAAQSDLGSLPQRDRQAGQAAQAAPGGDAAATLPAAASPSAPALDLVQRAAATADETRPAPSEPARRALASSPSDLPLVAPPVQAPSVVQRSPETVSGPRIQRDETAPAPPVTSQPAQPPDLNRLARQIYPILKRMLTAEMERGARR